MAERGLYVLPHPRGENLGEMYILVNDIYVQHTDFMKTRSWKKHRSHQDLVQYFKGTLLREVEFAQMSYLLERNRILCKIPESDTYFQCPRKDVKSINGDVYQLLLAIPNCRDRHEIFQNQDRLAEGLEMNVDSEVSVKIPNTTGEINGIIRYKGLVQDKNGIHFGIELYDADGRGNTSGSIGKCRYFQCNPDCGIFLPLNRVRPFRSRTKSPVAAPRRSKHSRMSGGASTSRSSRLSPAGTCPNTLNISKKELSELEITHDSEVYIFTEVRGRESQEKGKVKFIGRLPGTNAQGIYVGIDLDQPVGNGTGLYNGKHLFYTRQDHAALVPLSGILPVSTCNNFQNAPENNHLYEELPSLPPPGRESTSRRQHNDFNSSPRRHRAEENAPYLAKTFSHHDRNSHSSPSALGHERSYPREENLGTNSERSPNKRSPNRHSAIGHNDMPMDAAYGGRSEDRENRINQAIMERNKKSPSRHSAIGCNDVPIDAGYGGRSEDRENLVNRSLMGNLHQKQKHSSGRQYSRAQAYNNLLRENSENTSEDENSQLDLYGSDNSIASRKMLDRNGDRFQRNATSRILRPRTINSMPSIYAASKALQDRSILTAPGDLARNSNWKEDDVPIAQLVDFSSVSKEFENTSRDQAEMEVGTMVEVTEGLADKSDPGPIYGVIRWIGALPGHENEAAAGIELEKAILEGTDGTFNGIRYFSCDYGKGHFMFLKFCRKDPRFASPEPASASNTVMRPSLRDFGNFEAPQIEGSVEPPKKLTSEMIGKRRGIQGHHNSCYLDSTLFSLFAYSHVLDTILFRKRRPDDLPEYEETQKVLRELIINPLRKHNFVRADRIMQLRELLDRLGSVTGIMSEEKDPEEFLNTLLVQVFKAEPLMELRQGDSNAAHESHFYQIFMEKDEKMGIPSTQQLLEKSLISADLKFRNVPVCLIVQMPRFGKDYKMYKKLKPSLELDITNLVEDIPRSCDICERVAEYECRDCFLEGSLNETVFSYCEDCAERIHYHRKRKSHCYRTIKLPDEFREYMAEAASSKETVNVERQTLELFAVVCIATSHYVSFTKCGNGKDATWCFFDSMADRVGEQSGYNIPEITHCPEVTKWLTLEESVIMKEDEKLMPELKRRLLCDSYMCMYQSTDLMCNK